MAKQVLPGAGMGGKDNVGAVFSRDEEFQLSWPKVPSQHILNSYQALNYSPQLKATLICID